MKLNHKTIFAKQFSAYTFAIILSLTLVGVLLSSFFRSFLLNQKADLLSRQLESVSRIILRDYDAELNRFVIYGDSFARINNELNTLTQYLGDSASFFIMDESRLVFVCTRDLQDYYLKTVEGELIDKCFEDGSIRHVGSFSGMFGTDTLTVGRAEPVGDTRELAFFVSAPISDVNANTTRIFRIMLLCLAASAIFAFVLIYVTSRRISRPIHKLSEAARIISEGDFGGRIETDQSDEIGRLTESFNHMAESLDNQEKTRREFLSNISHDLRSPLTSMKGFLQAMIDGTIPPEGREKYLRVVMEETERLIFLANDILDLTKLKETQIELRPFDLNEVARGVIISFESAITAKELDIFADFEYERIFALGDSDKIRRVIQNLFDNAVKFTPQGGKIELSVRTSGKKVLFSILDSGGGISADEQSRVFERFYKSDSSRGIDKNGRGLGLAICRDFIAAHGSVLTLESDGESGSRFGFELNAAT